MLTDTETETPIRIFDCEVSVDEKSRWFFRGNEIIHENVLRHFKENLNEDESGIFILNRYGKLTEKGYISSEGFPLKLVRLSGSSFFDETGKEYSATEFFFYESSRFGLFASTKKKKIFFSLSRDFCGAMSSYMEEEEGETYLKLAESKIQIVQFEGDISVKVPDL